MSRPRTSLWLLLGPGLLWLGLFFVVPMYYMGALSLESGSLETGYTFTWEFSNYSEVLDLHGERFVRSGFYAGIATLAALLIAYPLAYAIAFRGGRWKPLLLLLVVAPFFTTYLIRTLAWQTILSDEAPVVDILQSVGLVAENGRVLDTAPSVIAGLTYNFLPFMILPIYAGLERLDGRLLDAALDLYASSRKAFLRVTLPLSAPGVVAGMLLTLIPALGDYVNALLLGGPNQAMIGNAIQAEYLELENYPLAAATAFILMAAILVAVLVYFRFAGTATLMGEEGGELTEAGADERSRPPVHGRLPWLRRHALDIYAAGAIAYMLVPIAVIAAFSFNDPAGTFNFTWQGFTTKYWADPFGQEQLTDAFVTSLSLAALTALIATAIGTMLALALVRRRFRGRRAANLLIILPLATPEVVIGAALLSMFIYLGVQRGFETLLLAHVMFCISFVVILVRSRLIGFDRQLEEAAADLGAAPLSVFRRITLPLIAPAVGAAALLSFVLSIDDFVISNFNSGQTVTFPLYIYGASQRGMPVEINVLATMLFAVTVTAMALAIWRRQRAQTRLRRTSARARLVTSPSGR